MALRRVFLVLSCWLVACGPSHEPHGRAVIHVAAASDLSRAFRELGARFEATTHEQVSFSFGSTGLLAKQIREGAPFDVFAAASMSFVAPLVSAGVCHADSQAAYGRGRIVVWSQRGAPNPGSLRALTDARFQRIAIANPEHAPYGRAAQQALVKQGLWSQLKSRIVYGENVQQALQFAQSGNAEVAIVAMSLVVPPSIPGESTQAGEGVYLAIDESMHAPIEQGLVVCKHGKSEAGGRAFARFVNSQAGRVVMRRYGFALPGETLVQAP